MSILFCYEHNLQCLPFFSWDCLLISLCLLLSLSLSLFLLFPFFLASLCSVFFFAFLFWGLSFLPPFFVFPYSCLVSLLFLLDMNLGACFFLPFFVSLCFMKRTTSKYSIRQVSFTNLCFVVVSKGPPHLTLKPSIFQLVSVFFFCVGGVFCCCWFGLCLCLCLLC